MAILNIKMRPVGFWLDIRIDWQFIFNVREGRFRVEPRVERVEKVTQSTPPRVEIKKDFPWKENLIRAKRVVGNLYKTLRVINNFKPKGGSIQLFADPFEFRAVGDATIEGDKFILTPNKPSKRGAVWTTQKLDLTKDWKITFKAYLGNRTCGADGLALVFQNSSPTAIGWYGGGLGYGGIKKSLAIELDTWKNKDIGDINGNHIGFSESGDIRSKAQYELPSALESDREIPVTVVWDYKGNNKATVKVGIMGKVYTYEVESVSSLFGGTEAYLGFTGATGGERNLQYVKDVQITQEGENFVHSFLKLLPGNTRTNPKMVRFENVELTSWVEEVEPHLYRVWFKVKNLSGDTVSGKLTLLNKNGEKPKWVGGNPFSFTLGGGEETIQYWALVREEDFPFTVDMAIFENTIPSFEIPQDVINPNVELFNFVGSAYRSGDKIVLTPNENSQRGAVWSNTVVDLKRDFEISFLMYLGDRTAGADGITFTMQNNYRGNCALGGSGGCLGIGGVDRSLSVEFDTWKNGYDPNGNHLGVIENGDVTHHKFTAELPFALESGREIPVKIRWHYLGGNSGQLTVVVDGREYTYTVEDFYRIFKTDKVFIGFTGATGGERNLQYIKGFSFNYVENGGGGPNVQKPPSKGGLTITDHIAELRMEHVYWNIIFQNLNWLRAADPFFSTMPLLPLKVWI